MLPCTWRKEQLAGLELEGGRRGAGTLHHHLLLLLARSPPPPPTLHGRQCISGKKEGEKEASEGG